MEYTLKKGSGQSHVHAMLGMSMLAAAEAGAGCRSWAASVTKSNMFMQMRPAPSRPADYLKPPFSLLLSPGNLSTVYN